MSNVIIQKINLYDLELQGNSSSDEEEENVAKNQQKQPLISTFLTKKSPKQQTIDNGGERVVDSETQVHNELAGNSKSPVINSTSKKSSPVAQKSATSIQSSSASLKSSEAPRIPTNSTIVNQSTQNTSKSTTDAVAVKNLKTPPQKSLQHPQKSSSDHEISSELPQEIVIKEEHIEIDDTPVIQQTWQDLDQHTFIKQENELMVPPDSLDGENIMEDEIEEQDLRDMLSQNENIELESSSLALKNSQLKILKGNSEAVEDDENLESTLENEESITNNEELGILDEKFGFFYKGSEDSHKIIEQPDEDVMTSQDIPMDFEDNLGDLEENPAKRMKIDYTKIDDGDKILENFQQLSKNQESLQNSIKTHLNSQNPNKIQTTSIVNSLPKGITVKRTSGRQVACKSTSATIKTSQTSPTTHNSAALDESSENLDTNGKVIAKIGENLSKIGETFVKFGKNFENHLNFVENSENTGHNASTFGKSLPTAVQSSSNFGQNLPTLIQNSSNSVRILPTVAQNSSTIGQNSTILTDNQDEFIVTTIKEEHFEDIQMEEEYTEVLMENSEDHPEKSAKPIANSDLAKCFTKNIGIVHKFGEISNQIVDRINAKRGEHASKVGQNSSAIDEVLTKTGQNSVNMGQKLIKVVQNSTNVIQSSAELLESSSKVGVSPTKFGLNPSKVGGNFIKVGQFSTKTSPNSSKVIISTKVIQNPTIASQNQSQRVSMPSTSYFMNKKFLDVEIKEEKLDDETEASTVDSNDPSNFLETKVKEEETDEYFSTTYTPNKSTITSKPINSTATSTSDMIVSTKVVKLPPANSLKSRKIIVIKKPVAPGMPATSSNKPASGHVLSRALKSQLKSSPGSSNLSGVGLGNTRYVIKTIQMPNKTIKIENNQKSTLKIASISGAKKPFDAEKFTKVTFPTTSSKIVVNQTDPIYRCQKCHLLFSSHSEYTEHLQEHRSMQGIVFNEKRVIKLEELQKMNAFQCVQCSAGFPTLEKLSAHENRHKTEFECKYCGRKFLQMYRYKEHLLQHEKKEKYLECHQCDKRFLKQVRLDEHMAACHAPMDAFPCSSCDQKFPTNALLQEHQKIFHTKRAAMKCGLCHYETYIKQNFEKHASMHMRYVEKLSSNQFFKCDQCPQSFREKGVLEMHKQHMHS